MMVNAMGLPWMNFTVSIFLASTWPAPVSRSAEQMTVMAIICSITEVPMKFAAAVAASI